MSHRSLIIAPINGWQASPARDCAASVRAPMSKRARATILDVCMLAMSSFGAPDDRVPSFKNRKRGAKPPLVLQQEVSGEVPTLPCACGRQRPQTRLLLTSP
jgi:hypothetical protein